MSGLPTTPLLGRLLIRACSDSSARRARPQGVLRYDGERLPPVVSARHCALVALFLVRAPPAVPAVPAVPAAPAVPAVPAAPAAPAVTVTTALAARKDGFLYFFERPNVPACSLSNSLCLRPQRGNEKILAVRKTTPGVRSLPLFFFFFLFYFFSFLISHLVDDALMNI